MQTHNFSSPLSLHLHIFALAVLLTWGVHSLSTPPIESAEARERLTFASELPQRRIVLPRPKAAPAAPVEAPKGYDLDKLARAVARHETASCTKGSGRTHNNCFGIMTWPNGKRQFKRYASKEDSYADFKRIWSTYYKRFPDLALAKRYSGSDRPEAWLANVTQFYSAL